MRLVVPEQLIFTSAMIPAEIESAIDSSLWIQVVERYQRARDDAFRWACLSECCCCVLFSFPCIFCCHPVIEPIFLDNKLRDRMNQLNQTYFYSRPVFTIISDDQNNRSLVINTDYMYQGTNISYVPPNMPYITVTEVSRMNKDEIPIAAAVPITSNTMRSMTVAIPEGVSTGDVIIVHAPTGEQLQVTIPPNVTTNEIITIQY